MVLVPWLERPAVLKMLERHFGRPMQLPFGRRAEEMFVAITPCAVVSNGVQDDSLEKMVARAQDIWLRGVRTGAVDSSIENPLSADIKARSIVKLARSKLP